MERVEVIRTRTDLAKLRETWNAVLERCPRKNVFLAWEWIWNWVEVYLDEDEPLVMVLYDGGEPRAIAPFWVREERRWGVAVRVLRFIGSGEVCGDHLDVLVGAEEAHAAAKGIWNELFGPLRREWDVLEYYDAPADSPVLSAFRVFAREDRRCLRSQTMGHSVCPYLDLPPSWEEFLARCSGSRRYAITYSMRKLAEQGAFEARFCRKAEDIGPFMDAFVSLHQKSWNVRGKPGAFASPRFEAFHRRVAQALFERGALFLCSFYLDGKHVGSFYGFDFGGVLSYYLMGVETNPAKRVKTGTAVIGHCVREAIRRGCREFDFLRGAEEYKYRWTSTDRRNPRERFYNRNGRASAILARDASYAVARKLLGPLLGKRLVRVKRLLSRR